MKERLEEILKKFVAACNKICGGGLYPDPIWALISDLADRVEKSTPGRLENLKAVKEVNDGAFKAAVEQLQREWNALPVGGSAAAASAASTAVSSSSISSVPRPLPSPSVRTQAAQAQSFGSSSSSSPSSPTPLVVSSAASSSAPRALSIAERMAALEKSASKPIPKMVTNPQGKSSEDKLRDARSQMIVDEAYLQKLVGAEIQVPKGAVPNSATIKRIANDLLDAKHEGKRRVLNEFTEKERTETAKIYAAHITTILQAFDLNRPAKPEYWLAMGKLLADNPKIPYVCDGAAALAFYALHSNAATKDCHLAIIEQGTGASTGHWFVAVTKDLRGKDPVIVDVWGANFVGRDSASDTGMFVELEGPDKDKLSIKVSL